MAYVPRRFPGRLLVFWPDEERPRQPGAPLLGWDDVADHIEAIHVPGDHHTIVTRHRAHRAHRPEPVGSRLTPRPPELAGGQRSPKRIWTSPAWIARMIASRSRGASTSIHARPKWGGRWASSVAIFTSGMASVSYSGR
jgi:hypothetical protein